MKASFNKARGAVLRLKLPHQPKVVNGDALQPSELRLQIGGQLLPHRLAPAQGLLLLQDSAAHVPVD